MSTPQGVRDLLMGARFAVTGGREGWVRLLLTAVGVGLGVALLLLTTAVPNALSARQERQDARADHTYTSTIPPRGDNTVVIADVDTTYLQKTVRGRLLDPEGPRAPLPPGLTRYPAKGDMVVSPALRDLLASDDGRLLRQRLPYRITGTIGQSGLVGSHELAYYAGADGLAPQIDGWRVGRIHSFGGPHGFQPADPVLVLLVLVVFVALLMPVSVFIATAVRFGGERRDRRLAALRLVGSDRRMTRRIAAGEALAGSVFGLVLGTILFLIGRQIAGSVEVLGISVFPSYLNPSPALALLVAVAVPAAAVLVTLLALRGVVVEPLGVVRTARPTRRRLWWRLLLPLAGLAMLYPMIGQGRSNGSFNQYLVIGGVLLLLVGVTALLPWIVEMVVARLGSGPPSWQLAVRRLQLSSGSAARMVNGTAVAVAGAIALHMLFTGVQGDYTEQTHQDLSRAQLQLNVPQDVDLTAAAGQLAATRGVHKVTPLVQSTAATTPWQQNPDHYADLTIGDCAALREVAALPSCRDGDVFTVPDQGGDTDVRKLSVPGTKLHVDTSHLDQRGKDVVLTVPAGLKQARSIDAPDGGRVSGFLVTPSALPSAAGALDGTIYLSLDTSVPDVNEYVRNTAARIDPLVDTVVWETTEVSAKYTSIRTGLFVGAACVLALIGASLLVSQLEQLRERRKLLSSLVAFGTRRRTLGLSVLWQTALPIALGLLLASAVGLALGAVLLRMSGASVGVDWASVLSMAGFGALVVLGVTLLSLPPLLRLMRPDGLRTE
jgi:hypothetical protein